VVEERDSKFPAFRRLDAYKWKKWKFYVGGVTLLPLRAFCGFSCLFTIMFCSVFLMIGQDRSQPISGVRYKIIFWSYWICARVIISACFFWPTIKYVTEDEVDYSYYLGADYKSKQQLPNKVSTLVCGPHQTWADNLCMVCSPL